MKKYQYDKSMVRVPEELKAEREGTKKDKNIRQVENTGLYGTHPNNHEIGYTAATNESIHEIAESAAGDQCQRYPDRCTFLWKSQQVGKTSAEQKADKDIEKEETELDWHITDDSQEATMIICEGKFDYSPKTGNFFCSNEDVSGRIFCNLITAD